MGVLFRLGWRPALTPCCLLGLHSSPGGGWKGSEQLRLKGRDCSCSSQALLTNGRKYFHFNCFYCSSHLHPGHLPPSFSFFSQHPRPLSHGFFLSLSNLSADKKQYHFLFSFIPIPPGSWLKEQVGMVGVLLSHHSA